MPTRLGPGESPADREAADTEAARSFADEVYATIRSVRHV